MWVITTHIGFSCLIFASCMGIKVVCKKQLERYRSENKKKVHFRRIKSVLIMFAPVLNVLLLVGMLYMISLNDEEARILKLKFEE